MVRHPQKNSAKSKAVKSRLGVQVISRAADVLRALEGNDYGLSLGQLAKQLGLPRSTVQRIVAALDSENFVIAASPTARVRLGPALVRIARSVRFRIAEIARPYLEALSETTGETVDLAMLDGAKAVFVDQIQGPHRLSAVSAVGVSFPLHCTANGKAMLAALDADTYKRLKPQIQLARFTERSLRSWPALEAELARVRETGIAYDREEHALGISAVGTAIVGVEGEIAAISIPTPSVRFVEKEAELAAALLSCRASLDRVLGNRMPAAAPLPGATE
jgi:IclR family transcriptional regulator, acetate operon repressor